LTVLSLAAALLVASSAAQSGGPIDVAGMLARIGEEVEQYFARAQSVVCQELVRLTPLGLDMMFDGSHARQLVYELRIGWDASAGDDAPDIKVMREIVTVDGRKPKPKDEPGCMDPKSVSEEPLTMLLPGRQREYIFTYAGIGRESDRSAVILDYKSREKGKIAVTRNKDCISIELPGYTQGRIWVDQASAQVLRLDERLTGMVDFDVPAEKPRGRRESQMTLERADSSTRYKKVAFTDPEETLLLPASIESLTIFRNAGTPRMRKSQVFSNYRRFVTGGRVVE